WLRVVVLLFLAILLPPCSRLFPYTTLFRSAAACARARIAAADPGDVRRQRTAAVAAGAIPASRGALHAVDLGTGIWIGGNRRVCALYAIHRTLAGPIAGGRL